MTIKINFEALHTGAADLETGRQRLHNHLLDLEGNIADLYSTWSGSAQAAYDEQKVKLWENYRLITEVIARLSKATTEAALNQHALEVANTNRFSG